MVVSKVFKRKIMKLTFEEVYMLKEIYERKSMENAEEYIYIVNLLNIYEEVELKKKDEGFEDGDNE